MSFTPDYLVVGVICAARAHLELLGKPEPVGGRVDLDIFWGSYRYMKYRTVCPYDEYLRIALELQRGFHSGRVERPLWDRDFVM